MDPSKPTRMLTLPPELLDGVTTLCDKKDLKSLRLACRELHNAADRTSIEAFFTHRRHLVTKYSLETLMAITSSLRLRSQIQSLHFAPDTLLYDDGQHKVDEDGSLVPRNEFEPTELECRLSCAYRDWWEQLERVLHGKDEVALNLIIDILKNLKSAGVRPVLGASYNHFSPSFGHHQLANMIGLVTSDNNIQKGCVKYHSIWNETALLLTAIAKSSLSVTDLRLLEEDCSDAFTYIFDDPRPNLRLDKAFKTIVSLHLSLERADYWNLETFDSFQALMQSCGALQHLSVQDSFGFIGRGTNQRLAKRFSPLGLKSLKLDKCDCASQDLYTLLEPHRKTLETLWIFDMYINEHSEGILRWGEIFNKLAASFALREIRSEDLMELDAIMCEDVAVEGTEEEFFPSTVEPKASLPSLPTELIEIIADYTDKEDLKSIRLTCRKTHAAVDPTFIKTFFVCRNFLVTEHSLQALLSIASSPRLRSRLQSIQFAPAAFNYPEEPREGASPLDCVPWFVEMAAALPCKPCGESLREWDRFLPKLFARKGRVPRLMTEILSTLDRVGVHPEIGIVDKAFSLKHVFGMKALADLLGADTQPDGMTIRRVEAHIFYRKRATEMLLSGLVDSGFLIETLTLHLHSGDSALSPFAVDASRFHSLCQSWSTLRSLILTLHGGAWAWRNQSERWDLQKLANSCTVLEHLTLSLESLDGWDSRYVLIILGPVFEQSWLRSIKLEAGSTTFSGIFDLLDAQRNSLEVLTISRTQIAVRGNPWSSGFLKLAGYGKLHEIGFDGLSKEGSSMRIDSACFEGVEEVKAGLKNLVSNPTF